MQVSNKAITKAIVSGTPIGRNFILAADSYKTTHARMLPEGAQGYFSYIEARKAKDFTIFAGLQPFLIKFLTIQITHSDIDFAEEFLSKHISPKVMRDMRRDWEYIVEKYNGFLPVKIKAVKEGMKVPTKNVLCTIECLDHRVLWLASYIETTLQRAIWYPTTVATSSFKIKQILKKAYIKTNANFESLDFSMHDFGGRGVTCEEQAQIGTSAHLFSFKGTDTMSGVRAANTYYFDDMAGFSVYASEHSIASSYGPGDGERKYFEKMLEISEPGGIISVVSDTYNVYNFVNMVTTDYLDAIIEKGCKVVLRPDSGDPVEVLSKIYDIIQRNLGNSVIAARHSELLTYTSSGYRQLPAFLGVLQGDGIDANEIQRILDMLISKGWAANSIVFGSGGALLQKHNRDTYKFAQKGSAIKIDGVWKDIFKDPITDSGKASKKGRLDLVRSKVTGEIISVKLQKYYDEEFESILEVVYNCGSILRLQSLAEIRSLINEQL